MQPQTPSKFACFRISFSLVSAPAGLSVNLTSGLVTWITTKEQVGIYAVELRADNGQGRTTDQTFLINVAASGEIDGQVGSLSVADLTVKSTDVIFLAGRSDLNIPPPTRPGSDPSDVPQFVLVRNGDSPLDQVENFPEELPAVGGEPFSFTASGGIDYSKDGLVSPDGVSSVIDDGGPGSTTTGTGWSVLTDGEGGSHHEAATGEGSGTAAWVMGASPSTHTTCR